MAWLTGVIFVFTVRMQLIEGLKKESSCGHVILLSPGRTATDTISHTLVTSAKIAYCHHKKEYFGDWSNIPNQTTLTECITSNKKNDFGGVYIHVKPQHITEGPHNSTVAKRKWLLKHGRISITPEVFFKVAKSVGFNTVVQSYRENLLARTISSFELGIANTMGKNFHKISIDENPEILRRAAKVFDRQLIYRWMLETHQFNEASKAAMAARFKVLYLPFDAIIGDVCKCAMKIAQYAQCPMPFECTYRVGHMDTSHRTQGISKRIGKRAAYMVKDVLKGTPFEWMLNLNETRWPPGVTNPVPIVIPPTGLALTR